MTIVKFPPLTDADEDGLLAIGGDLEVDSLVLAYSSGIFPWPLNDQILAWFAPPERAVIFIDDFHVSRSLKKEMRRSNFTVEMNTRFAEVMSKCAELKNRKRQRGTWITDEMIAAYTELHKAGIAHSIETIQAGKLVGGIYGVSLGGMFAAESMFYRVPNASKVALCHLVDRVRSRGGRWIDVQVLNPFTSTLGARTIEREEYQMLLAEALKARPLFDPRERS